VILERLDLLLNSLDSKRDDENLLNPAGQDFYELVSLFKEYVVRNEADLFSIKKVLLEVGNQKTAEELLELVNRKSGRYKS
jgi:translation initiation factor 2B subunit (eIF-2B alpha/beta/delta family)